MEIHIGVDVGGTFTDFAVSVPGENRHIRYKIPSTPDRPDVAIVEGIATVLAEHGLDAGNVIRLSHGTTVGTNALIQRKVGKVAVVTNQGFRDLLEIGRQVRPKVYDIHLDFPKPLVPRRLRLEVRVRRRADGSAHVPLDEDGVREELNRTRAPLIDFFGMHMQRVESILGRSGRREAARLHGVESIAQVDLGLRSDRIYALVGRRGSGSFGLVPRMDGCRVAAGRLLGLI